MGRGRVIAPALRIQMSEKVEHKEEKKMEEKKPETPATPPSGPKAPVWPKVMMAWMALMGLSWGATLAQALSNSTWLGEASIVAHRDRFAAGALGAGAAVAVAFVVLLRKKLASRMAWEKPGQGRWTRISALVALAALTLFGVTAFYRLPPSTSVWWYGVLWETDLFGGGRPVTIRPVLFPTIGIFLTVMFLLHLLLNQEKWAEFLIETEGELKKVSWPARKEYLGSASVVVLVVAIISIFLYVVDHGMSKLFSYMRIGF
jgi:preprotein translocase SecE subunit